MEFGLNNNDIERIKSVFSLFDEVEKVILYGSRAKGTFKPFSDIDLTLKGCKLNLTILQNIETCLDDLLLPYKFDISIYHHISNPELIEHINRIGKSFYSQSKFD